MSACYKIDGINGQLNTHHNLIILPSAGALPQKLYQYLQAANQVDIQNICLSLEPLQFQFFLYVKRIGKNAFTCLSNLPEWQDYYFTHHYYLQSEFETPNKMYAAGIYMWKNLLQQDVYQAFQQKYQFQQGLTVIKKSSDNNIHEFFHFGTKDQNLNLNYCLNNTHLLERFCLYFKDKAHKHIQLLSNNYLVFPEQSKNSNLVEDKINLNEFLNKTPIEKYFFMISEDNFYLRKKKFDCLKWYALGKTASEISIIENISKRTVETYLDEIKKKLEVNNKYELIRQLAISGFLGNVNGV